MLNNNDDITIRYTDSQYLQNIHTNITFSNNLIVVLLIQIIITTLISLLFIDILINNQIILLTTNKYTLNL